MGIADGRLLRNVLSAWEQEDSAEIDAYVA
jgi:hypothetical protein